MSIDIGTITKFARLKLAVPASKSELVNTSKELKELKNALNEKGDIEREEAKARFLAEVRGENRDDEETK